MSSLRKALPRREHKERHQLEARKHLGLLEKKKDYRLRAKDYHRKQDFLKKLQQKASLKNPDEFYFGMIKARTNKGVHEQDRTAQFDHESQKLMKTQDLNYLRTQYQMNNNRLERLKSEKQILASQGTHLMFDEKVTKIEPNNQSPKVGEQFIKEKKRYEQELDARTIRNEKLLAITKEMELQKQLMGKGTKKKVGVDSKGLAIYKWKSIRKK